MDRVVRVHSKGGVELTLAKLSAVKRAGVLRHGTTVAFTAGRAGQLRALAKTARAGHRRAGVVARGTLSLKSPGPGRVKLRLTARGRRLLRRGATRLTIRVTLGTTVRGGAIRVRAR